MGDAVNLAARIETIAPENEIYLSESANILLNKTQYSTDSIGKYNFKGQNDEVEVYKVNFRYSTKKIHGFIMFVDMRSFGDIIGKDVNLDDETLINMEEYIDNWTDVFLQSTNQYNGKVLLVIGDAFLITFDEAVDIFNFLQQVDLLWSEFLFKKNNNVNYFGIGVGWGVLYKYKQMAFSSLVNFTARQESTTKRINKNHSLKGNCIVCSNIVINLFKEKNLYDKSKFIEVTDLSIEGKSTHKEVVEEFEERIKTDFMDEDVEKFLPFHIFNPNPKSESK